MIDEFLFKQLPYINLTVRDTIIARYLTDNPNYILENTTTTGGDGTSHSVARIIHCHGRQRNPIVECRANERENALNILAFQLAAIQLPAIELAYIFKWMEDNPHTQITLWPTYPTELTAWEASIENFVTGNTVDSSQNLTIPETIDDLAEQLLVHLDGPFQTEQEGNDDD